ncbi:MAG: tyrosine-type recombinase/integrase [Negativicutes bacterium]
MSVRKRGKYYHIILEVGRDLTGKRIQQWIATRFTRKSEAEAKEAELDLAIRNGTYIKPSKKTVGEFLVEWLDDRKTEIAASTWAHYEWLRKLHIDPVIGHIQMARLRPADLLAVYKKAREVPAAPKAPLKGRGSQRTKALSPTSVNSIHRFLHKALGDASRSYQLIATNIAERVDAPKKAKYEPKIYEVPMINQLLEVVAGTNIEVPLAFSVKCGMRSEEARLLTWDDIKGSTAIIRDAKTPSGERIVELAPTVGALLERTKAQIEIWKVENKDLWQENNLVWCKEDGTPYNRFYFIHRLQAIVKTNEMPQIRVHDLRHMYVSLMLSSGAAPVDLAAQVGHSSVAFMLKVYAHSMPTNRTQMAKLTDKILGKKKPKKTPKK